MMTDSERADKNKRLAKATGAYLAKRIGARYGFSELYASIQSIPSIPESESDPSVMAMYDTGSFYVHMDAASTRFATIVAPAMHMRVRDSQLRVFIEQALLDAKQVLSEPETLDAYVQAFDRGAGVTHEPFSTIMAPWAP